MKLPDPRTACKAVAELASAVLAFLDQARSDDVSVARDLCRYRMTERHRSSVVRQVFSPYGTQQIASVFNQAVTTLPPSWGAALVEELSYPASLDRDPTQEFRYFLDVWRCDLDPCRIKIWDTRDTWTGTQGKVRFRFLKFPIPELPMTTFIVAGPGVPERELHLRMALVLAQNFRVTPDEEGELIREFFYSGHSSRLEAEGHAYQHAKAKYVAPSGPRPDFLRYWKRTVEGLIKQQGLLDSERNEARTDGTLVSLRALRRSEPRLARAIRRRASEGKLTIEIVDGREYVKRETASRVEEERQENSERVGVDRPRFPRRQVAIWVDQIAFRSRTGVKAARRKLKLWINKHNLTAEEIELSIGARRMTRVRTNRGEGSELIEKASSPRI